MMPEYHISSDGTSFTIYENQNWKMQFCLPFDKVWNSEAIYNRTAIAYGIAAEERIRQYEAYLVSVEKGQIEEIDSQILELEKRIAELKKNQNEIYDLFLERI
jgi:predicted phosphoadenosine phosphosulfate sulfurtransferase